MTGKVLELVGDVISPDQLASRLSEQYLIWENMRMPWKKIQEEINRQIYSTDTTMTQNSSLPWKNKTTIPKTCQIADNLYANYTLTMMPKDKSVFWLGSNKDSSTKDKREAIENIIGYYMSQPSFKEELFKSIMDYIHKGNAIATVEWVDERVQTKDGKTQMGFVGAAIRRISPLDCVMNPTAESFIHSPKFIRTIMSLGELKKNLDRISNDENREAYQELFKYLSEIRMRARAIQSDFVERDAIYQMDGFGSFQQYLLSNTVEVLTFYGDFYNPDSGTFEENRVITFVDRHKIMDNKPNPSFYGYPPIFHAPWRKRVDNLWGMGPLENLMGMQYRIDQLENQKADMMDLSAYPVLKIKGFVEDFVWRPAEKIFVSDEGDVEMLQPNIQISQLVSEIGMYQNLMEEMAGAPKEAMGFRSPGEKTKYEVQRLENASSRIFQSKINQFEEMFLEPLLNAMLELSRRNMSNTTAIPVMDDEFMIQTFQELTVEDITGVGRIKAVGARHFAQQAEVVQNLQGLANSPIWQYVQTHFSSVEMAKLYEEVFDLKQYNIVTPYINLAEQADAQRQTQALSEQLHMEQQTASGMGMDHDLPLPPAKPNPAPMGLQRNPPMSATPAGTLGTQ